MRTLRVDNQQLGIGLAIVLCLFCSCKSPSRAVDIESLGTDSPPSDSDRILAYALAGNLENIPDKSEYKKYAEQLKGIRFTRSALFSGHALWVDRIKDPISCLVERTYFDFNGTSSRVEIIQLPNPAFWARIFMLRDYYKLSGVFPYGTVDEDVFRLVLMRMEKEKKH